MPRRSRRRRRETSDAPDREPPLSVPPERIRLTVPRPGCAEISLAVPPVNVLSVADLHELARKVEGVSECRVLVLRGLSRVFSAGVEIAEHAPEPELIDRMLAAMRHALESLLGVRAVTVAVVTGACLGGGAELAAACDLVFAAEDARIGLPEIRLACFPPSGVVLLPTRIGAARAADWILTGRVVSGREAAEAGFASRSSPAASLERDVRGVVSELLSRNPEALAGAVDLLRRERHGAFKADLPLAEAAYRRLAGSSDLARAVREFVDRKSGRDGGR